MINFCAAKPQFVICAPICQAQKNTATPNRAGDGGGRWAGRAPSSTNPDRERVISRHVSLPDGAPVSSLRGAPTTPSAASVAGGGFSGIEAELDRLGVVPKREPKEQQPKRQKPDQWWKRGEECPH